MDLDPWKESEWEDTNKGTVGLYNRDKERSCAKKEEGISIVKGGERRVYIL